jgi:uncharacterized protein YggL (DUF469 family)
MRARQRRISDAPRRSRRLRKKLQVGEFRVLGFALSFEFVEPLYIDAENIFWDDFNAQAMAANGLQFGGYADGGIVEPAGRASVSESQRTAVEAWMRARPEIVSVNVGPLADLHTLGGEDFPTLFPLR